MLQSVVLLHQFALNLVLTSCKVLCNRSRFRLDSCCFSPFHAARTPFASIITELSLSVSFSFVFFFSSSRADGIAVVIVIVYVVPVNPSPAVPNL